MMEQCLNLLPVHPLLYNFPCPCLLFSHHYHSLSPILGYYTQFQDHSGFWPCQGPLRWLTGCFGEWETQCGKLFFYKLGSGLGRYLLVYPIPADHPGWCMHFSSKPDSRADCRVISLFLTFLLVLWPTALQFINHTKYSDHFSSHIRAHCLCHGLVACA
jgi:hypothetical protein